MIQLDPYQEAGVEFLCDPRYTGRLLADEMGLGKTIQAVVACTRLGARRVLVLCPAAVKVHWQKTFRDIGYRSVGVNTLATDICIWNYDHISRGVANASHIIKRIGDSIRKQGQFDVLILDEAHLLAKHTSMRTLRILGPKGLHEHGKRVFALTGTPVLSSPADFYSLLCALWPQAVFDCPAFETYAKKFCGAFHNGQELVLRGATNVPEFKRRLEGFMLRRTVEEVDGTRVKPKLYKIELPIDLTGIEWSEDNHITARRVSAENKVPEVLETLGVLAEHHGKIVVFAHHKSVIKKIACFYPNAAIIKGGQTPTQRKQFLDSFINGPRNILVIQIRAGGTGLDGLQAVCDTGVFIEDDWTPAQIEQAMGRLDRRGQEANTTFYFVSAAQSDIEDRMQEALERKRKISREVLCA